MAGTKGHTCRKGKNGKILERKEHACNGNNGKSSGKKTKKRDIG